MKIKCFFMGHSYPKTRADRTNPFLSMTLLMDPKTSLTCERCGHQVEARWQIVYQNGVDHLEAQPIR